MDILCLQDYLSQQMEPDSMFFKTDHHWLSLMCLTRK